MPSELLELKPKNSLINQIYADWEQQRKFFLERMLEAEDVIDILS